MILVFIFKKYHAFPACARVYIPSLLEYIGSRPMGDVFVYFLRAFFDRDVCLSECTTPKFYNLYMVY